MAGLLLSPYAGWADAAPAPRRPSARLTPEAFGAVGYPSAAAAARGRDTTEAIQRLAIAAAARGQGCSGTGDLWYKVGTVSWPSRSDVEGLRLVARGGTTDVTPFLVDGRKTLRRSLRFTDCHVDGNRSAQRALTSSGGDGRRCGWMLSGGFPGAVTDVTLVDCSARYCATDGFFTWCNAVAQSPGDTPFFSNVRLLRPDFQWNGRHGGSSMGIRDFCLSAGRLKNNGKDMEAVGGDALSGALARRAPHGGAFGRPWDCEGELAGEGFSDVHFIDTDMRGNAGGLLFHHVVHEGWGPARDLSVERCLLDDPLGTTTGDGALLFYAIDARTGRPFGDATTAFDGVLALDNHYARHGIAAYNADNLQIVGGYAAMTGPGFWGHYAMLVECGRDVAVDVASNRPRIFLSEGKRQGLAAGTLRRGTPSSSRGVRRADAE